jgi:hypothetical protein
MKRSFYLFDQFGDVVQRQPWPKIAKVAGCNLERLARRGGSPAGQPTPQRLIDDVAKGPARTARL